MGGAKWSKQENITWQDSLTVALGGATEAWGRTGDETSSGNQNVRATLNQNDSHSNPGYVYFHIRSFNLATQLFK